MRWKYSLELLYEIASLLTAALIVHAVYVTVVWPRSETLLAAQAEARKADPNYVPEPSVWIILRDYEQESEIVLMLWALSLLGWKAIGASRERRLLQASLVPVTPGHRILPEDAREYARQLQALPAADRQRLLPRALLAGLNRFSATRSIEDVSSTARGVCEAESARLDTELSMLRYVAWAIPSIGFIGTVRGIGMALGQAQRAVEGDISGVTTALGTAFNSTLIALLISIVLMFLMHRLQLIQERLVLDTEIYLDEQLLSHLQVP